MAIDATASNLAEKVGDFLTVGDSKVYFNRKG